MLVSDVRVDAVAYRVTPAAVVGTWIRDGAHAGFDAGRLADVLPRLDLLRDELRRPSALARGHVPRLDDFAHTWGRELLPAALLDDPPDVLVVLPHAIVHGVPLHVVLADCGRPLGTRAGVSYASSTSLFGRCAARNAARARDARAWSFDPTGQLDGDPGGFRPASAAGGGCDVLGDSDEAFARLAASVARTLGSEPPEPMYGFSRRDAKMCITRSDAADALCIVAHGYLDPRDHRFSGLLLDRDSIGVFSRMIHVHGLALRQRDLPIQRLPPTVAITRPTEILTTAEIELDALVRSQLVLLLACSAGWSLLLQADAPASIADTFLRSGAPSVVAPLWDSHYDATEAWTMAFMRGWVGCGMPKAFAARLAMNALVDAGCGPERSGALALRGDWV